MYKYIKNDIDKQKNIINIIKTNFNLIVDCYYNKKITQKEKNEILFFFKKQLQETFVSNFLKGKIKFEIYKLAFKLIEEIDVHKIRDNILHNTTEEKINKEIKK